MAGESQGVSQVSYCSFFPAIVDASISYGLGDMVLNLNFVRGIGRFMPV